MPQISLATYSIRVRKKRLTDEFLEPRSFDGQTDLYDRMTEIVKSWGKHTTNPRRQQVLRSRDLSVAEHALAGWVETGDWGYESQLYDVDKSQVTHLRSTSEAEMIPFYFLLAFPKGLKQGFLIVERFGARGIRKMMTDFILEDLADSHPEYHFEINPQIMEEVAEDYLRSGRIIKISFVRYEIPEDIADYVSEGVSEDTGYSELVIHAKRNGSLPFNKKLSRALSGNRDVKRLFEIRSFEYDDIKVQVEHNGLKRTFEMSGPERIRSYFNVDDQVEKDEATGHPLFDSIDRVARDLLSESVKRISS